jgi:hypothetical protein
MTDTRLTLKFGPQRHVFDLTPEMQLQLADEAGKTLREIVASFEDGSASKELAWMILVGGLLGAGLPADRARAGLFSIVLHGPPHKVIEGARAVVEAAHKARLARRQTPIAQEA